MNSCCLIDKTVGPLQHNNKHTYYEECIDQQDPWKIH